jgi:Fur family ferric uptake transcriptional regulator
MTRRVCVARKTHAFARPVEVLGSPTKRRHDGSMGKLDERFRALLSSKDLRITDQRLAVLRSLARNRAPVSFPELVERLAEQGLDRATVYRNLVGLTEAGILVRTQLGDGAWRSELPQSDEASHGHHPHLVCVDCGGISCLPANTVSIRKEAAARVTEVQLRGHCESCSR